MASNQQGNKVEARLVSASTTPAILSPAGRWISRTFVNEGAATVRIGTSTVVSANKGILLAVGAMFTDEHSLDAWYVVTTSATATVSVIEIK